MRKRAKRKYQSQKKKIPFLKGRTGKFMGIENKIYAEI